MRNFINSLGGGAGGEVLPITANLRVATYNIYYVKTGGDASYLAVEKHILRVDADLLFLTEVSNAMYTYIATAVYLSWGYSYIQRGVTGNFGNCTLSKVPIESSQVLSSSYINTISGQVGAVEMPISTGVLRTRHTVDGQVVLFYGVHLQTGNAILQSTVPQAPPSYARWVNLYRIFQDIENERLTYPNARIIIAGDYNNDTDITQTGVIASEPSPMHAGWVAGADLAALFPVQHSIWPTRFLNDNNFSLLITQDLAGNDDTWIWRITDPNGEYYPYKFDYVAISNNVVNIGSEIMFSDVDANTGLPKVGSPLSVGDSERASDHKMVFADLEI